MNLININNSQKRYIAITLCFLLFVAMLMNISGCSIRKTEAKTVNSYDSSDINAVSEEVNSSDLATASEELNSSDASVAASEGKVIENSTTESVVDISAGSDTTTEVKADNLMNCITSQSINEKSVDDKFIKNTANFSIELFKKSITERKNSLISPLSVLLALSMTANGADNETLSQMEKVLGGDISIDELNEYLYFYVNSLPNDEASKLNIANSIWFNDDENCLTVKNDFLQKNADYYNAAAYKSAFDDQTLIDINNWVKTNTDGKIDKIIDQIDEDNIMYLINTIVFDSGWLKIYTENQISRGEFTAIDGSKQTADFMRSEEIKYLDDGKATGFIKPYVRDNYSFVALLPNEGISIDDYISSLTGEEFMNALKNIEGVDVVATLPKFSYDYTIQMNDALKILGMPNAFSDINADFSKLGKSPIGNIYIGGVLQKTFISVDEYGTSAGAAAFADIRCEGVIDETKTVTLNRPFVYAIIDNKINLPIFIGTVMNIQN